MKNIRHYPSKNKKQDNVLPDNTLRNKNNQFMMILPINKPTRFTIIP